MHQKLGDTQVETIRKIYQKLGDTQVETIQKIYQKLGDTQVETIRKIQQAFGNEALSLTQIKQWFKRFKDGRASVESDPRSGRPSTSQKEEAIDQVCKKVLEDRRLTVQEIVAKVGISTGPVHSILTEDLNLRSC